MIDSRMFDKIREALEELVKPVLFANATLEQVRAECLERAMKIAELLDLHLWLAGSFTRGGKPPVLVDTYTLTRKDGVPVADVTFYVQYEKRGDSVVAAIAGVDLLLMFRHGNDLKP